MKFKTNHNHPKKKEIGLLQSSFLETKMEDLVATIGQDGGGVFILSVTSFGLIGYGYQKADDPTCFDLEKLLKEAGDKLAKGFDEYPNSASL